ncbi:ribonuclease T2 [Micractinium conductrix]|uniref:Ribonuclease T2 n=1 Tax=Micractinium conductrix TaxID=554055 RepID=A0A2P6VL23_9CHLO|nr:ribonuclease T2 [Micractinium conductrix]|eukprot:PSC74802.1 ribonuclease T2 [Micractinium conductrix]
MATFTPKATLALRAFQPPRTRGYPQRQAGGAAAETITVLAAAAKQKEANTTAEPLGFDYLMLSRRWGPSFCELNTCDQRTYNLFTIHGLWPNNKTGENPAFCPTNITFSKELLPPQVLGRMSCEWRSLRGNNEAFWTGQWRKHGACTLPLYTNMSSYFRHAIMLSEQYDLNEALVSGGFNPIVAERITPAQMNGILRQAWNVTPTLVCVQGLMYEVRTCFSVPDMKIMECPVRSQCGTAAQNLPLGSAAVPEVCSSYFDNIPPGLNPLSVSPPPPPRRAPPSGAPSRAGRGAATLAAATLAAAVAALAVL